MAYKKTSEASLRKHDSNTKVKKDTPKPSPSPVKATPAAPKASVSKSTSVVKKDSPAPRKAATKASPPKPKMGTRVTGRPDAPVSSNRASVSKRVIKGKSPKSTPVEGKDVSGEYTKNVVGLVIKKRKKYKRFN